MAIDVETAGLLVAILALLGALAWWQQRVSLAQRELTLQEIEEANREGSDRPAVHRPIIDEAACIGCGTCVTACPEDGVLALVDGIARVVHASRCRGHATCIEACPVAAVQLGSGGAPANPNLPRIDERQQTSLRGVYAAGELTGMSLIRNSIHQSLRAMEEIAADLARTPVEPDAPGLDLLIVGAGPAGIAASLRAKELGLHALVIDQDGVGGAVRHYPRRKLTLTGALELPLGVRMKRDEYPKEDLVELWESAIRREAIDVRAPVRLTGMGPIAGGHRAETTGGEFQARRVLLAVGGRGSPRRLGVPGEDREKVLYRLIDAASYRGQDVLVVGGGDSAAEAALALAAQPGNRVTLAVRGSGFHRLSSRNRRRVEEAPRSARLEVLMRTTVRRIEEDSVHLRIEREDGATDRVVRNHTVIVCAGGIPPRDLLASIGVQLLGDAGPPAGIAPPSMEMAGT